MTVLRQELLLLPAPPAPDGRPRLLVHDPVAGRYHRIGADVLDHTDEDEVSEFLRRSKLTAQSLPADALAREEAAARPSLGQLLVQKYLFFRIPLVRPQAFLDALAPWCAWMFSRVTVAAVAMMGVVGLVLAARQWDAFVATFLGFLTPQGMLAYGLTLVVLKALHELGHGLMAQRFGVHVPVMGVAFLVMFPVLYTDTTGTWELTDRRRRLLIDAGGMIAELLIACLAIFAWSFLPDGPARQIAFFVATTSWTLSLLVNLNPCMRFDGYYLIGDALGVANLQATGFGLGRWRMREALFGWGDPQPDLRDANGAGMERVLLAYAYATWVYRFFLFIGIALLVHHIFPTAIGIVLFIVEIGMFIALPAARELRVWINRRADIVASPKGRRTLAIGALALAALFAPLSGRVSAPALVSPARTAPFHAPAPSIIDSVEVRHGDVVDAGQVLLTLASPELDHDIEQAELSLASARAQLSRAEATPEFREDLHPLRDALARAQARLDGAQALQSQLTVRAAQAGRVEMADAPRPGQSVGTETALLTVLSHYADVTVAVPETVAHRLQPGARASLVTSQGRMSATLARLSPVGQAELVEEAFASSHGGALAVDTDESGLHLRESVIMATLTLDGDATLSREWRGTAFIDAERQSVASRIWRRVRAVLLREFDF